MRQSLLHRSGFMPVLIVLPMLLSTNPLSCGIMKSSESSAIDHRINNKVAPPVPELEINGGLLYTKIPSVPILIKEQLGDGTSIRFGNRSHSEDVSSLPALDDSCLFSDYLAADQLVAGDAVTLSYTYDLQENLSDGPLDICAQLKTSKELASDIVLYPLTYDTTAAVLSSDVANEISFDSTKSKSFTLSGKATDASGIKSLNFSLENLGTGKCLNDKKTAFQATTCPNWLVLPAAVDWSIDIVASLFEAGENYAIALNSEDLAGNLGEELDLKRFNWNLKQPISSDFTINNDATYSISRSVSLRLGSGDSTINDIRVAEGTECSSAEWQPYTSGLSILFTLSASDGEKSVCLQVRNSAEEVSVKNVQTIYLDTTAPAIFLADIAATIGPLTTAGVTTVFSGTATDDGSGVQKIYVSLENANNNMCLSAAKINFDAACPNWLEATGTAIWTFTSTDGIFNANDYTISVRAQDMAGIFTDAMSYATDTFTWDLGM